VKRHLRPEPRLQAGERLRKFARSALDVSDGVAQDLSHLAHASGVAAELHADRLPLPRGFAAACARLGLDPFDLALAGGEDFELLFTAPAKAPTAAALTKRLGCRVSEIGRIKRGSGVTVLRDGEPIAVPRSGYDHFKADLPLADK